MRFERPEHIEDNRHELPMTSFIDVVFLLLIFFMITASFVQESELRATLKPEDAPAGMVQDLEPQVVLVRPGSAGPEFVVGTKVLDSQRALTILLTKLPKQTGVFIRADPGLTIEPIAAALQAAKDAGFEKVSYVPAGS